MSMSKIARHLSKLDIRDLFRLSISVLTRPSPQLDIRDFCRMSISELPRHSPQRDIRNFSECRCKSWLDIRPSSIFGTFSNVDVRTGSTFTPA
ncbi:hypothetical protein DPMN_027865 [Dreissena polymorpha]|uniref:Uncharacterized protein n=1 Tax=Dreissena polymorpha TaxID=45954 RepID=A0A9D4LXW3_DREPO|nr:hypothetical protein DPMN_027865 [Dreissena polymorpha]